MPRQVLAAIQELNLENDTIACYTSDRGEMLGELVLWQKFQFYEQVAPNDGTSLAPWIEDPKMERTPVRYSPKMH